MTGDEITADLYALTGVRIRSVRRVRRHVKRRAVGPSLQVVDGRGVSLVPPTIRRPTEWSLEVLTPQEVRSLHLTGGDFRNPNRLARWTASAGRVDDRTFTASDGREVVRLLHQLADMEGTASA